MTTRADERSVETASRKRGVVVGVDGSADARHALREATRSAVRRSDRLTVITAYEPPEWIGPWGYGPTTGIPWKSHAQIETELLDDTRPMVDDVRHAIRDELGSSPEVRVDALPGRPADVLVDAAAEADELVVGHRGRGAVAGALFGSTSMACVFRAPCPVTVVPPLPEGSTNP